MFTILNEKTNVSTFGTKYLYLHMHKSTAADVGNTEPSFNLIFLLKLFIGVVGGGTVILTHNKYA